MAELRWHYGPTDTDPDPGKRWHYECGGEVWSFDGSDICSKCDEQGDDEEDSVDEVAVSEPSGLGWVAVLSYSDRSGIEASWGPFRSEDEAKSAIEALTKYPIQAGLWETVRCYPLPPGITL